MGRSEEAMVERRVPEGTGRKGRGGSWGERSLKGLGGRGGS